MQETVYSITDENLVQEKEPLTFAFEEEERPRELYKYVFTSEDDPHLEDHRSEILTCSLKDYSFFRRGLMNLYGAYVALTRGQPSTREKMLNEENPVFLGLLGSREFRHQVFIVPVMYDHGVPEPMGRVRFVEAEKYNRSSRKFGGNGLIYFYFQDALNFMDIVTPAHTWAQWDQMQNQISKETAVNMSWL